MGTQLPGSSREFDGLWVDPSGNGWDFRGGSWLVVKPVLNPDTGQPFTQAEAASLLDAEDVAERSAWRREQFDEPADLFESVPCSLSSSVCVRKAA